MIIEQVAKQLGVKFTKLEYDIYGIINYRCKHGIMHPVFNPMAKCVFNIPRPKLLSPCHDECCKRFKYIDIEVIEEE